MLRILQICILFQLIVLSANAQCYSGLSPQNTSHRDITFKDSLNGFIIGDKGNLLRTYDKGLNWEKVEIPQQKNLDRIKFFNDNDGVISSRSDNLLFISRDGGNSWDSKLVYNPEITNLKITDFHFNELGQGIIIGNTSGSVYSGRVLLAENFGETILTLVDDISSDGDFNDLHFVNDMKGFIVGENANFFKTEDGGLNWESIDLNLEPFNDNLKEIIFTSEEIGYIFLEEEKYFKTEDGGETWSENAINLDGIFIKAQFLNDNDGFIYASSGVLYKTSDGGVTWSTNYYIPGADDNSKFYFLDTNYGIFGHNSSDVIGSFGGIISITEDCGDSWQFISQGTNQHILDMAISSNDVLLLSTQGNFYRSDDSGVTWLEYSLYSFAGSSDYYFREIDFPSATQAIGMVTGGLLLYSNDEGLTWDTHQFDFSWGAVVASEENVWMVYTPALDYIKKTSDGGDSWSDIDMPLYPAFMTFTNEQIGYAVSYSNQMCKTTDAGATWTIWDLPITQTIKSLYFYNENIAYIGCDQGVYYKSVDGGLTWEMTDIQTAPYSIHNINFADENHGIMSAGNGGSNGRSYETFDGGQTWEQLPTSQTRPINTAIFIDNQHAYLSGEGGTFFALNPGEAPYVSPYATSFNQCSNQGSLNGNTNNADIVYFSINSGDYIPSETGDIEYQWDTPGINTISVYAENACGTSDVATWELEIIPEMEPIEITVEGNTLMANSQPNYQWYLGNTLLENATNQTLEITEEGFYTVESYNICGEETATIFAVFTNNEELSNIHNIDITPNPASSNINIISSDNIRTIFIYNAKGQRVYQMENINNAYHQINLNEYPDGVYHVQIFDSKGKQKNEKIVKH